MIDEFIDKPTVFREPTEDRLLCEDARLSGVDVLPRFECRVAELFSQRMVLLREFSIRRRSPLSDHVESRQDHFAEMIDWAILFARWS